MTNWVCLAWLYSGRHLIGAFGSRSLLLKLASKFPDPLQPPRHPALAPATPPELPEEVVAQALRSFERGKGPGPDGLRADFLRLLLESPGGDTFLGVLRDFVQLLVDGRAPLELRPWDARPIVMGTTWRKLCFKTTFLLDKARIQERLAPQQFAVGVRSGAEAMIHATRAWLRSNSHRRDYVLLQRDVSNAFNSVHTHMFLDSATGRRAT